MRADWISTKFMPKEVGTYLVTTAKGAVLLDRWDGETWGRCTPRCGMKRGFGRYSMHKAWTPMPSPARKEDIE